MKFLKFLFLNLFINILIFSNLFCVKAVIFEIDDVLIKIDETEGFNFGLAQMAVSHYRNKLFDILSQIPEYKEKINTKIYYKNIEVPNIWGLYYLNSINNNEAYEKSCKAITDNTYSFNPERSFLLTAASISFDPEKETNVLFALEDIINLAKLCKENNNIVLIFSNKNPKSLASLIKKFPILEEIFKDNIIISGQIKKLKPEKEAYNLVLKKFNIAPGDCFIIESQEKYAQAAKDLGMNSILFKDNNINEIKEILYKNSLIQKQ